MSAPGARVPGGAESRHESGMAERVGAVHAVAFGYARHALAALLEVLNIGAGDEVVLSPLTCQVVPLALLSRGVRPRWADIDPGTLNLSPAAAREACTSGTRAILFQHTYGLPGGASGVLDVARSRGIPLIEDRAQCMPLRMPVLGVAALYSNNFLKPLPAGSGGLALTDDSPLAAHLRARRDALPRNGPGTDLRLALEAALHAAVLTPRRYWPMLTLYRRVASAYQSRSLEDRIAAEILATAHAPSAYQERRGLRWLQRADQLVMHRRAMTEHYQRVLGAHPVLRTRAGASGLPLLYFPLLADAKRDLLASARAARQEIIPWPGDTVIYPLQSSSELSQLGYVSGSCPQAEWVAARLVGLPTHLGMTPVERDRLLEFLSHWRAVGPSG